MRRKLSISILLIALGLLLGHEVIPHHHHDEHVVKIPAQGHDHNGEGNHLHHLLDLFFSVLHHVDENTSVYVQGSLDGRTSDNLMPSVFAVRAIHIAADVLDSGTTLHRSTLDSTCFSLASTTPSLRGPPLM